MSSRGPVPAALPSVVAPLDASPPCGAAGEAADPASVVPVGEQEQPSSHTPCSQVPRWDCPPLWCHTEHPARSCPCRRSAAGSPWRAHPRAPCAVSYCCQPSRREGSPWIHTAHLTAWMRSGGSVCRPGRAGQHVAPGDGRPLPMRGVGGADGSWDATIACPRIRCGHGAHGPSSPPMGAGVLGTPHSGSPVGRVLSRRGLGLGLPG